MKDNTYAPAPILSLQGHSTSADVKFKEMLL